MINEHLDVVLWKIRVKRGQSPKSGNQPGQSTSGRPDRASDLAPRSVASDEQSRSNRARRSASCDLDSHVARVAWGAGFQLVALVLCPKSQLSTRFDGLRNQATVKTDPVDNACICSTTAESISTAGVAADVHAADFVEDDVVAHICEVEGPLCDKARTMAWRSDVAMLLQGNDIQSGAREVPCDSASRGSRPHDDDIEHPIGHRLPVLPSSGWSQPEYSLAERHASYAARISRRCVLSPARYFRLDRRGLQG